MGSNHFVRRVIAIVIVITVLFSCICVNADGIEDERITEYVDFMWNDAGIYMIYLALQAMGIDVTLNGVREYTEAVHDILVDEAVEFVDSLPSVSSIVQWVFPWMWSTDWMGNYQYNESMWEDIADFATYLENKWGLVDNSIKPINPVYDYSGYTLFPYGEYIAVDPFVRNGYTLVALGVYGTNNTKPEWYFMAGNSVTKRLYAVAVSDHSFTSTGSVRALNDKGNNVNLLGSSSSSSTQYQYCYANIHSYTVAFSETVNWPQGIWFPVTGETAEADRAQIREFLQSGQIVQNGEISVVTSVINIPSGNDGLGMTINDGEMEFSDITFPSSVSVSNLPAIIARNNIQNPSISSIWHYVSDTIDNFDDGVSLIRGVVYSVVPSPYLLLAYAALVLLLVFGLIKVARK